MNFAKYFNRYGFHQPRISASPRLDLGIIVVIPVFAEPGLLSSVISLSEAAKPACSVELILVFNASENSSEEDLQLNLSSKKEVEGWYEKQDMAALPFRLFILEENALPKKHAGVGLARKIGMDEALNRFHLSSNLSGVIACFDADSLCQTDYFQRLQQHFSEHPETSAASIYFEHPLSGNKYSEEIYRGICLYELHLRYYKNALAFAGLPFGIHTIGSSMAVRAINYQEQGGMNKRKAGEDFYFLQKFIELGTCTNLVNTCIIPSPRISSRVPFGTGRALKEMVEEGRRLDLSYNFDLFLVLRDCFSNLDIYYEEGHSINHYLEEFIGIEVFEKRLAEIRENSSSKAQFQKRFFRWFNAFKVLKFVHFLRDNYFENKDLKQACSAFLIAINYSPDFKSEEDLLLEFRKLDKQDF